MEVLSCPVFNDKLSQSSNKFQRCMFCRKEIRSKGDNQDDCAGYGIPADNTFLEGISVFCDKLNVNPRFSQMEEWRLIGVENIGESVCCQSCNKLLKSLVSLHKLILETQTALNKEINKMKDLIVDSEAALQEQTYSVNICNQFREEVFKCFPEKCKNGKSVSNQRDSPFLSTTAITSSVKLIKEMPVPFVKLERIDMSLISSMPTTDVKNEDHFEDIDSEIKGENSLNQEENDNEDIPGSDDWNDNQQNQSSIPRHNASAHSNGKIGPKKAQFKCEICGQRLATKMSLQRHKKLIHGTIKIQSATSPAKPEKFNCPICSKSFDLKRVLDRHVKFTHKSTFSCAQCPITFDTQRQLMHHKYEAHKKHKLTPSFLKRLENAKKSITEHDSATNDVTQSCVICSQEFTSWGPLDQHLTQHEKNLDEKSLMCYFCDHRFAYEQSIWAHLKTSKIHMLTKVEFHCDHPTHLGMTLDRKQQCVYQNIKDLESHFGKEHSESEILKCGDCGWPFLDKNMLELHRLVHLPRIKYKYQCPVCANTFTSTDSLQHHYNSCHGANLKLYRCGICGWGFSSKTGYAHHIRMHDDKEESKEVEDKLYSCSECPKKYNTENQLYNHKRQIHVTSQCSDCGEVMSKSKMSLHRRMKHDVEQHLCIKCGKVYKKAIDLKQHMSSHGEYVHVCQYCGSGSRSGYHLRRHIKRMHKDQAAVVEGGGRDSSLGIS